MLIAGFGGEAADELCERGVGTLLAFPSVPPILPVDFAARQPVEWI
jgi:hypothetical protein